jgi:hypothetical protein
MIEYRHPTGFPLFAARILRVSVDPVADATSPDNLSAAALKSQLATENNP